MPEDASQATVLVYTLHDRFRIGRFDKTDKSINFEIADWVIKQDAAAYLCTELSPQGEQQELPQPIGRPPMDLITQVAASPRALSRLRYYVEPMRALDACRLLPAGIGPSPQELPAPNLLAPSAPPPESKCLNLQFSFAV